MKQIEAGRREEIGGDGLGLEEIRTEVLESVRLGHDLRFLFVAVGGGGIRVGRDVARRRLPYLETVAINCDPKVQELGEFDRRLFLSADGAEDADTDGAPSTGGQLARSARPALERIFEGAHFVTIVASLGGGTGTGVLPYVLEAAARSCSALKVFVVKPFECEGERRALAGRALARLHFLQGFADRRLRGQASLEVLDNEEAARHAPTLPIGRLERRWADRVAGEIEHDLIRPAEAVLASERDRFALPKVLPPSVPLSESPVPTELLMPAVPRLAPLAASPSSTGAVELTFEIDGPTNEPTLPPS